MLAFCGQQLNSTRHLNVITLVTGACYSPKVLDYHRNEYEDAAVETSHMLTCPFKCRLAGRPCRVTPLFTVADVCTSDELYKELVDRMSTVSLYVCEYEVRIVDGYWHWSEVTSASCVGQLWGDGQELPLFDDQARAARENIVRQNTARRMKFTDPLDPNSTPVQRSRGRGRGSGRGRGRRASGRGNPADAAEVAIGAANQDIRSLYCTPGSLCIKQYSRLAPASNPFRLG